MAAARKSSFSVIRGIALAAIFALAGVLLVTATMSRRHLEQRIEEFKAKGAEFGRLTDQVGCMQEGILRAKATTAIPADDNGLTSYFVDSCLRSSRPTPGFCELVPSSDVAAWENVQCEKPRLDTSQAACLKVLDAQVEYCRRNNGE